MSELGMIEVLARGVHIAEGRLLVCHTKGSDNTYLPGGHVEFKESARDALIREMREEMGVKATIGRFLGCVEHSFLQDGHSHCEINLVFVMQLDGVRSDVNPESEEDYIDFEWLPADGLRGSDLQPATLRGALPLWLEDTGIDRWAGICSQV